MVGLQDLPPETLIETLRFLDYNDQGLLQQATRGLNSTIERYKHELPLCQLHQIEILPENKVILSTYRRARDIAEDFELSVGHQAAADVYRVGLTEEQEQKWAEALNSRMPLYAYPEKPESILEIQDERVNAFILFISTKEERENQRRLSLELPNDPANMDDLFFIRFWLDQLARVHFHYVDFGRAFFNPEMLKTLFWGFPLPGGQLRFHSSRIWFRTGGLDELHNARAMELAMDHLATGCLTLRVRTYYEAILNFLLAGGARIAKVVFPNGPGHSTVELQNLLIFHAESSMDSPQMVKTVEFQNVDDLQWPQLRTAKLVERGTGEELDFTRYRLDSLRYPGMEFSIEIGHFAGAATEFKRFSIQRVLQNDSEQ